MQGSKGNRPILIRLGGEMLRCEPYRLRCWLKCTGETMMLLGKVKNFTQVLLGPCPLNTQASQGILTP
ncbi:hypothetical protein D3C80_1958550 [compost metagenome]